MDAKFIAQCKAEYYESLAEHPALHDMLNRHGGLILARVGGHPPWPARFSEPGEFTKMVRHRQKKGYLCVYFFGTRNFGWVHHNAIMPFSDDYTSIKASKKYSSAMVQRAIDSLSEAEPILRDAEVDDNLRFYDRIMENKYEAVDMPCEVCNRVDDHFSNLILCDGNDCKREYHMNCLTPPLEEAPPGDWFCPECIKESTRQMKMAAAMATTSSTVHGAIVSNDSLEQDSSKTQKKEKTKLAKTGSHKRKLPTFGNNEMEQEGVDTKKIRQQSSGGDVSPLSSSPLTRPPTPVVAPVPAPLDDNELEYADVESEERCLICGYGGEVVVCEFYGCTKVYHQFCLGTFHFPKDDDVTWFCPRHRCAVSGALEMVDETEQITVAGKGTRKVLVKKQLWKCTQCPVALSDDSMPSIPKSHLFSRINKSFLCAYCAGSCPLKVLLAKTLEKMWAFIATNHQALPFCGPLLSGLDRPSNCGAEIGQLDLFRILAKIRRLEYENSLSFVNDINCVVSDALEIIQGRSQPLIEAARTMEIMCREQMTMHHIKIEQLDNKIKGLRAQNKADSVLEDAIIGYHGYDRKKWPLRWRQECGVFGDKSYPIVDARSLADWTAYVTAAPMYVSVHELERAAGIDVNSAVGEESINPPLDSSESYTPQNDEAARRQHDSSHVSQPESSNVPSFSGLTLSEGTDVMMALTQLSRRGSGNNETSNSNFERVCRRYERDLEESNNGEFFLSPSIAEMQQMFGQQSALLRHALESHSILQKAWLVSKQKMLEVTDGFSVAEGRLVAELRLANKNLRARLRNKDKLVNELTGENMSLRAEVKQLQNALAEAKTKVNMTTTENGDSDGISSAEGTPSGRKSPRTNKPKAVVTQVKVPGRRGRPPKKVIESTQ